MCVESWESNPGKPELPERTKNERFFVVRNLVSHIRAVVSVAVEICFSLHHVTKLALREKRRLRGVHKCFCLSHSIIHALCLLASFLRHFLYGVCCFTLA